MVIHNKDVVQKDTKNQLHYNTTPHSDEELEVPLLPTSSPHSDKHTQLSQLPQVDTSTPNSDRFWEVDESNILPEDAKRTRAPLNRIFYYHKVALTKALLPPRKFSGKMRVIPRPAGVDVIPLLELFVVKWDNFERQGNPDS